MQAIPVLLPWNAEEEFASRERACANGFELVIGQMHQGMKE